MKCKNNYSLPIKKEDIESYSQTDSPVHVGKLKYCIDFYAPEGIPIYSVLDGIVTYSKGDSKVGGFDKKYWDQGNRIVIRHENGEYSAYEHMGYNGVLVDKGDKVNKGQLIGYVGSTGYIAPPEEHKPHLHFEIFHKPDKEETEGTTLEVNFKELLE